MNLDNMYQSLLSEIYQQGINDKTSLKLYSFLVSIADDNDFIYRYVGNIIVFTNPYIDSISGQLLFLLEELKYKYMRLFVCTPMVSTFDENSSTQIGYIVTPIQRTNINIMQDVGYVDKFGNLLVERTYDVYNSSPYQNDQVFNEYGQLIYDELKSNM